MVKWISDIHAEKVLEDLKISYQRSLVSISAINKKSSLQNPARIDTNLDEDNVESITRGASDGDPIPALVIRKTTIKNQVDYIIAGGNHRLEAMIRLGEQFVECYIVEIGESEFFVLCQILNLSNGKSVSRADRIDFAIDALDKGICKTQKEAAAKFRIDANTLSHHLNDRKAIHKLASRVSSSYRPPMAITKVLEKIQLNEVHAKAFEFVEASKKLKQDDVVEVIKAAMEKPTVAEQIATLENAKILMPERAIASPDRQEFLKALRKIDSILSKHKTLASLDIVTDQQIVKDQVKLVIRRLGSL